MHGIILINAYSSEIPRQALRLRDELGALGVSAEILRNGFFPFSTDTDVIGALDCDFCVYLDKDKYVARLMEKTGVRLFNRASAIELCDDKMLTHIELAGHGIPMPETLPGLLCYDAAATVPERVYEDVERRIGYPIVVKQSYGSMGKGVFKANDRAELVRITEELKCQPHLFQRFAQNSSGRDLRVIVVGGEVIGGIMRVSDVDFRSNIGLGAHAQKADVPKRIRELALRAAAVLGLDYCGIDFLPEPTLLCEVNSNAFFDAFEAATGINVARAYAEHIVKCMTNGK